jgi:hypothetical protein
MDYFLIGPRDLQRSSLSFHFHALYVHYGRDGFGEPSFRLSPLPLSPLPLPAVLTRAANGFPTQQELVVNAIGAPLRLPALTNAAVTDPSILSRTSFRPIVAHASTSVPTDLKASLLFPPARQSQFRSPGRWDTPFQKEKYASNFIMPQISKKTVKSYHPSIIEPFL